MKKLLFTIPFIIFLACTQNEDLDKVNSEVNTRANTDTIKKVEIKPNINMPEWGDTINIKNTITLK